MRELTSSMSVSALTTNVPYIPRFQSLLSTEGTSLPLPLSFGEGALVLASWSDLASPTLLVRRGAGLPLAVSVGRDRFLPITDWVRYTLSDGTSKIDIGTGKGEGRGNEEEDEG